MIASLPDCGPEQHIHPKPLTSRQFQLTYDRKGQDEDVDVQQHGEKALYRSPDSELGARGKIDDFGCSSRRTEPYDKGNVDSV